MMTKNPKARREDAEWYDTHYYKTIVKHVPQWYSMAIPRLQTVVVDNNTILEVGCGRSPALQFLSTQKIAHAKNLYGIDQSSKAIAYMKKEIPDGTFIIGDIYSLPFKNNMFDCVCMFEVIEHLEDPTYALAEISRVIKPGGILFLSFPNFSFFPWRIVRFCSDFFRLPRLINKQPIDNIYTINEVIMMARRAGFELCSITGVTYLTALLTPVESLGNFFITRVLNRLGLGRYSLHPLFEFRKI